MAERPVTAVVTGAAMGMGKEISQRLIAEGVTVAGLDLNAGRLEAARAELGEAFEPVTGDVGDWDAHQRAADAAESRGQLRHWVNNAGIDIVGGAHEVTPEHITAGCGCCSTG